MSVFGVHFKCQFWGCILNVSFWGAFQLSVLGVPAAPRLTANRIRPTRAMTGCRFIPDYQTISSQLISIRL